MKVFKVELMILDFDKVGEDEIVTLIEQVRYPNHCLHPKVMSIENKEIGRWNDDNPLNCYDTMQLEFNKLFNT